VSQQLDVRAATVGSVVHSNIISETQTPKFE
jgi:hypothetical protein